MESELKNAYFAGLIDGEGSIGLFSIGKGKKVAHIEVKMTCKKTIQALKDHFGCGTIWCRPPEKTGWKVQYRWRVRCKVARNILITIRPYLITKRANANSILSLPPNQGRVKKRGKS